MNDFLKLNVNKGKILLIKIFMILFFVVLMESWNVFLFFIGFVILMNWIVGWFLEVFIEYFGVLNWSLLFILFFVINYFFFVFFVDGG